ncbi:restriction endonuclease subunit S [Staphylococcus pseudoxylosus]|uniref:restriction endonuclease subunit S n=1 Tax=Staphylococcus pseudoxylosus TaxID=2282419 RepID=UPI003D803DE1
MKKFMSTNHVGSAQPHITKKDFGNITIKIPISINEQKVIGDFFNKLDNIIENQSNKIIERT